MKSARITVAHVVFSLGVGGLENIVLNLVGGLDPERFGSVVFCLKRTGALAADHRLGSRPVILMDKRRGFDWFMPLRLARRLRRLGVDIVHCHNYGPLLYGSVAGRLAGVRRVVYTSHGPESSAYRGQGRIQRLGLVDHVVAISDHVRDVAVVKGGVDAAKITTIHNGVDVEAFARSRVGARESIRDELGMDLDAPVIGVVARLTHEKDHATLLRAFALVHAHHPAARLALAGDGDLRDPLIAQAGELGVRGAVSFLGTRGDVPDLLSAFDVFALPSRIEGLGITLVEAMAAGLPTVASRVGGIPEVVIDGETGRVVPPGDAEALSQALSWMLENRDRARAMGEAGRRRAADEFSLERMVRRYEAIYLGEAPAGS